MQEQLLYLREEHGDAFATRLPTGQIIPWRPLSMGEFIEHQDALALGAHPPAYLEDEIFKKCVLDTALVKGINQLKAGIVATVVATILSYSGPSNVEELNQVMDFNRTAATKILNDLVNFVCQAFPAYKPEEVYEMDYSTLMLRVAMGERKMLQTGIITEPLHFDHPEAAAEAQVDAEAERAKRRQENSEMMDRYYEQQGITVPDSVKQSRTAAREQIMGRQAELAGDAKPPPLSIAPEERTIISKADIREHQTFIGGDAVEQIIKTGETAEVYEGYLEDLREGKELKILTPEERKAAALERMEKNRLANVDRAQKALDAAKEELPKLLKVREEARKRKERKAARRRR